VNLELHIERWPIERLIPFARNPRTHSDEQVAQIAASIAEFGFVNPVLVGSDGVIIAGHARLAAARKLGLAEVPVIVLDHLSEAQRRALVIADNKLATNAGWDEELLRGLLTELRDEEFNLDVVGFSDDELNTLLTELPDLAQELTDEDAIPEPLEEPVSRRGDLWVLGNHRLLCGDSASREDVERLVAGETVDLVNTDPPYNVRVEPRSNNAIAAGLSSFGGLQHHQSFDLHRGVSKPKRTTKKLRPKDRALANDFLKDADYDALLRQWFSHLAAVLKPGGAFYIWGGYANCANYPPALAECGLYFSQAIIWVKNQPVLTRKDFMGAHEWCQPADTQVMTPDGLVPIQSLRDGDRVVSYSRNSNVLVGLREGLPVRRTQRPYHGALLSVQAGGSMTYCTPGHHWSVKLAPWASDWWCVYLMRRGAWWRVGKSRLRSSWGFGVKHRLKTEGGEAAWILSVHPSNVEATIAEQLILAEYGIPTTTWSESASSRRTLADVRSLYERLDLTRLEQNACRLLVDHGRSPEHPFLRASHTREKIGARTSRLVRACNLLSGVMMIPVAVKGQQTRWEPVHVEWEPFEGEVYSLEVARYGHYVADGLVTHNCFYGWREGAAHWFNPDYNNVRDVWEVSKVPPQAMVHLTEKPVELAVRALTYSSRAGEVVLDLFGGSGSTLIAAEKLGRRARLMEIDPAYADVIIRRWQEYTGKKAVLDGVGRSFEEVADERQRVPA
jgi:DNA modification methylase